MSEKKLDKLFQDKFLDFKEVPDDRVWKSIEVSLNKKKKKRVLPLWWQLGGIAAALLLGFVLFNPFMENNTTEEIITDVEHNTPEINTNPIDSTVINKSGFNTIKEGTTAITSKEEMKDSAEQNAQQLADTPEANPRKSGSGQDMSKQKSKVAIDNWNTNEDAITQAKEKSQREKNRIKEREGSNFKNDVFVTDSQITQTDTPLKEKISQEQPANTTMTSKEKNVETSIPNNSETAVVENTVPEEILEDARKKSIFEEIEAQEEVEVAEKNTKKWSAGPSVAPVYFNAIGEGSSVHSIFVPNSKSGNINLSYGLSVAYEISPKLTVRSGVHKVDYGYDTNDVAFSSSLVASTNGQIDNIDYSATSKNLVVSSRKGGSASAVVSNEAIDVAAQNPERDGVMSQQLGYVEVPVELNYALVDNKFGVNLIGGISSLFLVDNSVALTSGSLTTEMGEANNVNDLNFSANVGLGVNYKFSPKVQLNLEPMFKYQLNTFSETDGTFNPYSLGIYSGLSFRF
ncbi:outer membrane beta-barrel protein [Maribacter sp. R77961]|uniref:outer membrane beta-barrel protein n=1 Tax=Maribacter sp. R77961 TaxID=3093871 RepID=UPI0037C6341A